MLSGVQPTDMLHLGRLLGATSSWSVCMVSESQQQAQCPTELPLCS